MTNEISDSVFETEHNVRWGRLPDRPDILYNYLSDCEAVALSFDESNAKRLLERAIDTFVEVICDPSVPYHWRCLCLDNLYRPISRLRRIEVSDDAFKRLNKKMRDINVLTKYFLTY